MRLKILLLSLSIFLYAALAQSATYYVCNSEVNGDSGAAGNTDWETGVDTTAGGQGTSRGLPWATIEYAMSSSSGVTAGDTVVVAKGTYDDHDSDGYALRVDVAGSAGNYIAVCAETRGEVVLTDAGLDYTVYITSSASYIQLDGLDISGGAYCVMIGHNSPTSTNGYIIIKNCTIHEQDDRYYYSSAVKIGVRTHHVTFDSSCFYGCGTGPIGYGLNPQSLGYAIYAEGTEHVVQNCVFRDPAAYAGPFIKIDGYDNELDGYVAGYEVEIVNNTFDGFGIDAQDRRRNQIWAVGIDTNERANNLILIANNAFRNPTDITEVSSGCADCAICIHNAGSFAANDIDLYSNRTDKQLYGVYVGESAITVTASGNLDEDDSWGLSDFDFVDQPGNDYQLNISSALISNANASYAPPLDYLGRNRPVNLTDDIGAYEFAKEFSITTTDSTASEVGPATGAYTVDCPNCVNGETVEVAFSGTATITDDYTTNYSPITWAGSPVVITLTPVDSDGLCEAPEYARATIQNAVGAYISTTASYADISIDDDTSDCAAASGSAPSASRNSSGPTWSRDANGPAVVGVYP